jgi:DNA invertase Pin-like site-specific DNA recombinase
MIYAYLRISTNENKQKHSFDYQLKEIKSHFHVGKVFKETVSGSAPLNNRKALLELMETVKKGDKVIVIRLDRLSRDTMQSGWIRYELEKKQVELITLENKKKDSTSNLIDNILLAFAQYERETIKWRIQRAFELKKQKGQALGGNIAKYGYEFYYQDGVKMIRENPHEQKIIKRIYQFRNKTPSDIARILGRQGVKGKNGKTPICRKQVQRILERKGK